MGQPHSLHVKSEPLKARTYSKDLAPRILCLDGGGMRGVVEVEVLKEIERRTNKKVGELFDLICGTSTGGLLSFAMVYKGVSAVSAEKFYLDLGKRIFRGNKHAELASLSATNERHSSQEFEKILKEVFEEETVENVAYPFTFVTSTDTTNESHPALALLGNTQPTHLLVWECLRATSAAPTYFKHFIKACPANRRYEDGGLLANNPTEQALIQSDKLWSKPPVLVFSIGTGRYEGEDRVIQDYISLSDQVSDIVKTLTHVATDTESVHQRVAQRIQKDARYQDTQYFRFNISLPKPFPLDVTSSADLLQLQELSRAAIGQSNELEKAIAVLME